MLKPQISVGFVRSPKPRKDDTAPDCLGVDMEKVGLKAAIIQETSETVVKALIVAYVAKKLVDTACQIAVIAADAKFNS